MAFDETGRFVDDGGTVDEIGRAIVTTVGEGGVAVFDAGTPVSQTAVAVVESKGLITSRRRHRWDHKGYIQRARLHRYLTYLGATQRLPHKWDHRESGAVLRRLPHKWDHRLPVEAVFAQRWDHRTAAKARVQVVRSNVQMTR